MLRMAAAASVAAVLAACGGSKATDTPEARRDDRPERHDCTRRDDSTRCGSDDRARRNDRCRFRRCRHETSRERRCQ